MKRTLMILLFLSLLAFPVFAEKSIMETMEGVDKFYYLVLDNEAVGADTFAAAEIQSGLIMNNDINITTVLEGEVSGNLQKIFISPPCGKVIQEVLDFDCDYWPYDEGEAIIIAHEGDIYITGTVPNDRRRAGLILKDYPDYDILTEHSFIIVKGLSLDSDLLELIPGKSESDFVCGDGICDPGEKFLCYPDCGKKTCFDICNEEGFSNSFCRDVPSNPNVDICLSNEVNKGLQYCTSEKSCCCEIKQSNQNKSTGNVQETPQPEVQETKKQGFFAKLFSEENRAGSIVVIALVLVSIIILIGFIMAKG